MTPPRTLPDLLFHACAAHPKHGLTFAEAPGSIARVPYPALLDQARVHLAGFHTLGARKGDEVVISIALPSEFLPVFWACQLGGMVAVPAAPLTGSDDTVELERLDAICRTLRRPVVVCDDRARARITALLARSGGDGRVIGAASLCADGASDSFDPGGPDDLAMVQFSSGSTRAPKGVALRHRNLVANCLQMTCRLSLTHHDVEVGWLPLFHDMGLIGCHVTLTLVGARQVKIPTDAFLERPAVWLRAATQARATLLAGTNTALRLLLRRVDPSMAASFDLRSVRNFLVSAEPVFPAVVRATQSLLSSAGLPPTALRVAYGLAECCVGVAADPPDRSFSSREVSRAGLGERVLRAPAGASDTYEVSEIGPAYDGCEVRVVDDDDGALEDGLVGHLQVRGPQVMAGYLRDAATTEAAFCGEWLRTGDLGYLVEGRIGVCGRSKETIIVAGRNVFASDAESVAASVEGVQSAIIAPVADSEEGTEAAAMFVVLTEPDSPAATQVLESARRKVQRVARLPLGWVVPVSRKEIPRTSSGKVRRLAMGERLARGDLDDRVARVRAARWSAVGGAPPDPLESRIRDLWGRVLRMPPEAIGVDDPFLELGGSSVAALEVLTLTEAMVGRKLGQEMLASCSTVKQTAAWIRAGALETPTAVSARPVLREPTDGLAITAIACRFPGARDAEELHDRLLAGECRIVEPPRDRMGAASLERLGTPRGSFLEDPYAFDASFFGIPEDEARFMDPQQRLALELAAEALENAGLGEQRRRGLTIGTFLGVSATPYRAALPSPARIEALSRTLESLPAWRALPQPARDAIERDLTSRAKNAELAPTALVGNLLNMVAARVAHAFDLTGPSMAIDTACSSSLVAVHLACEALKQGECDAALAGGVHLSLDPDVWHFLKAAGVLSPTGRCVPFADGADGIVPGEGGAILVLRRWSDARAAADPVRAAILGSAIGGDGGAISPMAPNPRGQRATIEAAYRNAGVEPQSIAALEAHGTGTLIGDPIELGVQAEVFSLAPAASIAVGSVKSNLGHLLAAAGIAGLTKMIVSLERRELPPTLHAQPANPRLPLAGSPLRIAHRRTRLDASHPLRAGVSAFGFGGTNAHVVLERAEPVAAQPIPLPACALPLSAPSREHLEAWARALAECPVPTEPLCRELSRGRTAHAARAVRVLRTADDARRSLADFGAGRIDDWLQGNPELLTGAGRAVLLFPGQGAQSVQQARGLLECWPAFRERLTGLIEKSQAHEDLFAACYGADASDASVRRTDIAQPLLVAFQIALAQTVIDAGISPLAVVGHSVGELSAAAIAGAMDPAQAVRLAAVRGSLMQQRCRPGAMIAVALPAVSVAPYLADQLESLAIASLNAPAQTVVAGTLDAITALSSHLERDAVAFVRIPVGHAFHSPLVSPILDELEGFCRTLEARDPVVPLASTVHGHFACAGELAAEYWRDHAALPVRFEEALRAAAGEPQDGTLASWFLEIGPGTTLSKLARRILGRGDVRPVVSLCRNPSDRDDGADVARALHALGTGWVCGASVDWSRFQPSTPGTFARIPSVPFRRKHLRIDEPAALEARGSQGPVVERPETTGQSSPEVVIEELALSSESVATPPTRRVEAGRLPLTPAQAGFVFLEESQRREAPIWFADVPVHGEVDPERFRSALAEVIRRHPTLRAVFRREGTQWVQQVLPACDPPLFVHDTAFDEDEIREVWADVRATRFELSRLPLFRVVLVRSAPDTWRLMLAVHHIIGDAWSLHVVIEDLASALTGEELPALDASWSEVVAWHARTDPHRQASKDYWRGFFSRAPSPVRWAPTQGAGLEGTLVRTVDRATTARLREIARGRATTLHACVLTVWFESLRSELGEDDLTTGTASGGREIPVPDVERMVGCLATTIPVRAKVSGDFDTDLREVSKAWEQAWEHGDVPVYESWLAAGEPQDSLAPGLDLYFSFMESGSLAARRDAPLRFDLSSAKLHFSADSAGHRAMLTVLAGETIRLQLRGDAPAERLRALAERMARGLQQLASRSRASTATLSVKDDAAIVAYLPSLAALTGAPDSGADAESLRRSVLPRLFPHGEPQWMESTQTPLGRTAAVFLPLFSDELAQTPAETLADSVASAVRVARARGARSVSLAGMLPSLTSYGHAVRRLLDPDSAASLTSGHAATTAAVVATIRRALVALQRTWADQRVAIVGFGSMGQGIAGLMLAVLGRPRGIVVCDRREALPLVAEAVHALERAGQVPVTMVGASRNGLPDAVYDCEVVVGATSRGGILDVRRLADGAMLADDSFPPIYDRAHVPGEVFDSKRVLVVGAGRLSLSSDGVERRALELPGAIEAAALSLAQETGAAGMLGCRVEKLLVAGHGLRALSGLVDAEHAQEAWDLLAKLGVDAAPLHVGARTIPDEVLEALRR